MKNKIIDLLKKISDPEIDINIWDLGLIYDVSYQEGKANIKMTLTAPGCPFMAQLASQVEKQVGALKEVKEARVDLVFDPPWTLEKMTEEGRKKLGL
ncbi:MAG: iron-sulfur cluster assembly protein [Candidatus Shapirobacteria bacterium]|nr:iron-sulfur cluster assembly protein [Candidatus Shapirobacteria bacterium]